MGWEVSALFCEFPNGRSCSRMPASTEEVLTSRWHLYASLYSQLWECTPLHWTPTGSHQRVDIQTGDEIKHERERLYQSLYSVLVSVDVIVYPSGLDRRGAPAGLVDVVRDKPALCGAARDVLVVLKMSVCGCHTKCSVNFRAHVLQMSSRLGEFIGAFIIILTFWS